MAMKDDILFNLEINYELEFIYHGQHYYLGYNDNDDGCYVLESPDKEVLVTHSNDRSQLLDAPLFKDGRSINEAFEEIEFTFYQPKD